MITKTEKLLRALRKKTMTVAQIQKLGIPNPSAAVSYLRDLGEPVITSAARGKTYYGFTRAA